MDNYDILLPTTNHIYLAMAVELNGMHIYFRVDFLHSKTTPVRSIVTTLIMISWSTKIMSS